MPEPMDEFDRSLRDRIDAAEARVRVSSTAPAGGAVAPGPSRWLRPALMLTTAAVAVVLAVLVIGQLPNRSVGDATPYPSAGEGVSASARNGNFVLTLSSPRSTWSTEDAIDITAALSYDGDEAEVEIGGGGGPVVFSLVQLEGGNAVLDGAQELPCLRYQLGPDEPLVWPFQKEGSIADEPPFDLAFFQDPDLHLPPGLWEVRAVLGYGDSNCGDWQELAVSITLGVLEAAGPPGPSAVATEPPVSSVPPSPAAYVIFVQNEDDETYRVELIEVESRVNAIFHPWTIGPGSAGIVEIPSTLSGELQVRHDNCGAIASWEVEPGQYRVIIRDGAASLEPSGAFPSAVPLPTASTCIFSGP